MWVDAIFFPQKININKKKGISTPEKPLSGLEDARLKDAAHREPGQHRWQIRNQRPLPDSLNTPLPLRGSVLPGRMREVTIGPPSCAGGGQVTELCEPVSEAWSLCIWEHLGTLVSVGSQSPALRRWAGVFPPRVLLLQGVDVCLWHLAYIPHDAAGQIARWCQRGRLLVPLAEFLWA